MKKFYITTTIPYVNADPHIGLALELLQADAIARYKRLSGYDVCFNWGTDEHGLKIYRKAIEQNKEPQKYCDEYAVKFKKLISLLNLSSTNFIRTTDNNHIKAAREFWTKCLKNGDIYKKTYHSKYCVGCELEKTDSELDHNRCPVHPTLELEIINEENYFFRFSKYQKKLLALYDKHPDFVIPQSRLKEIKTFVKKGLVDFSVSRLKKKMPWGVDVPNDPEQVMYVWFDALINYISTIGWPDNKKKFQAWWPVVQIAGKDNLRQQSAIWQAMLISAELPTSKQIFIHGFITSEGQRMSKSLGNVVSPADLVDKYGLEPLRYYLLREIPPYDDGDYSDRRFKEIYNADLANGLGNLIARVAKLCQGLEFKRVQTPVLPEKYRKNMEIYRFDLTLENIWLEIKTLDRYIDKTKPWQIKKTEELYEILVFAREKILTISYQLQPFLPETSEKITKQFSGINIKSEKALFPRMI